MHQVCKDMYILKYVQIRSNVELRLKQKTKRLSRKNWPNLTPLQLGMMNQLTNIQMYTATSADKNGEIVIMETKQLTQKGVSTKSFLKVSVCATTYPRS